MTSEGKTAKILGRDEIEKQSQKSGQDGTSQLIFMCKNICENWDNHQFDLMYVTLLYQSVDEYVYSW